jgi:hypothetical protein
MGFLRGGLVSTAPERPCDDIGWSDALLREALGYPTDFLDRPADEVWRFVVFGLFFLGIGLFA